MKFDTKEKAIRAAEAKYRGVLLATFAMAKRGGSFDRGPVDGPHFEADIPVTVAPWGATDEEIYDAPFYIESAPEPSYAPPAGKERDEMTPLQETILVWKNLYFGTAISYGLREAKEETITWLYQDGLLRKDTYTHGCPLCEAYFPLNDTCPLARYFGKTEKCGGFGSACVPAYSFATRDPVRGIPRMLYILEMLEERL